MAHTVLVGFDDSPASRRALDLARDATRREHGRLIVLAVLELPVDPTGPRAFGTMGDGPPAAGPFREPPEITSVLDAARTRLEGSGARAEYRWAPGDPAALLIATAAEHDVDLVVIGEHHHGLLGRLLGGDVATEVRRHAGCEVRVVE